LPDTLALIFSAGLRVLPSLVLLWLAYRFGVTLRTGSTPLIEQVARCSKPMLPVALCRYTRALTTVWCAYFLLAALLVVTASLNYGRVSLGLWTGTLLLFVGEHRLRRWIFPNERFPGLAQQLRDTLSVWRRGG
jgi:uncharacterized membrane protein